MSSPLSSPHLVLEAALRRRRAHILAHHNTHRVSAAKHRDKRLGNSSDDAVAQLFAPEAAPVFLSLHNETVTRRQRARTVTEASSSKSHALLAPRTASPPRRPSSWAVRRGGVSIALAARRQDIHSAHQPHAMDEASSAMGVKKQANEVGVTLRRAQTRLRQFTRARRRGCLKGITHPTSLRRFWCEAASDSRTRSLARCRRRRVLRRALRAVDVRALPCKKGVPVTRASLLRRAVARANSELWRLVQTVAQTRATFLAALSQQQQTCSLMADQSSHVAAASSPTMALAHAFPLPGAVVKVHWCRTEAVHDGGETGYGVDVVREQHGVVLWETLSSLGVVLLPALPSLYARDVWALVGGGGDTADRPTVTQGEAEERRWARLGRVAASVVHVERLFTASSGTRACAARALAARLPEWRRKHGPQRQFLFASIDHNIAALHSIPPLLQCLHNRFV